MGFDLFGLNPKNGHGEYFRNNVWWWRPLWSYVCRVCEDLLTNTDCREGDWNNGHNISETKAEEIAQRLGVLVTNGDTQRYSLHYSRALRRLPDEECEFCKGTGRRNDNYVKGMCNACQGKGKLRPFAANYPFRVANVRKFIEFCGNSGGFRIC
jgi:hypothetical protein